MVVQARAGRTAQKESLREIINRVEQLALKYAQQPRSPSPFD